MPKSVYESICKHRPPFPICNQQLKKICFSTSGSSSRSEGLGVYCICNEETFIAAVCVPVTANGELKVTV